MYRLCKSLKHGQSDRSESVSQRLASRCCDARTLAQFACVIAHAPDMQASCGSLPGCEQLTFKQAPLSGRAVARKRSSVTKSLSKYEGPPPAWPGRAIVKEHSEKVKLPKVSAKPL